MQPAAENRAARTALVALALTVVLTLAKLVVWIATSSLAVLSQAMDSTLDVLALTLVFLGVRLAAKPADETHHYGHGKAENLVAFTQTLILGIIVIGIVAQAIARLAGGGGEVDAPVYALVLLAASVVVDLFRMRMLVRAARTERSEALTTGALNIAVDVATAVVALVSLFLVRAGIERADAVGGLIVAAGVAVAGVRVGKRSVDVLMDRAPGEPSEVIGAAAARAPGVAETRRVRVRSSGNQTFADVTVATGRTTSLERAHDIAEGVEREIAQVAPGTDVVVHVEPAAETAELVERVQAAASRVEGVHEIHNVLTHSFNDQGERKLHVTLHAKTSEGASIGEAHELSDRIEEAVEKELGRDVRVDTHIEPLELTTSGTDVTEERQDVVAAVHSAALEEKDVIDCHEVLVTSANGNVCVVVHVRARDDLPLAHIHQASERIEKAVQRAHQDVGSVLIHFEPA